MVLPNWYIQASEGAVASYDFYDLAARVGYKKFYGFATSTSGTTAYALSGDIIDSTPRLATGAILNGSPTSVFNQNFDITFKAPQVISGTAYINCFFGVADPSSSAGAAYGQVVYTISKVSGGSATSLGTATGVAISTDANTCLRECIPISIASTKFAVGDSLRLNVNLSVYHGSSATGKLYEIWFDPASRQDSTACTYDWFAGAGAVNDTSLVLFVPFRIDL